MAAEHVTEIVEELLPYGPIEQPDSQYYQVQARWRSGGGVWLALGDAVGCAVLLRDEAAREQWPRRAVGPSAAWPA